MRAKLEGTCAPRLAGQLGSQEAFHTHMTSSVSDFHVQVCKFWAHGLQIMA